MEIRPYLTSDRDACLAIFDSNTAHFPVAEDRASFAEFLDRPAGPYFIMEHDGATIGCGGYQVAEEPGLARLIWGMIRSDLQRQGLGRFLLMYRLREIGKLPGIERVLAEVPGPSAHFFEGQGFKRVGSRGQRVELVKKLNVCP